MSLNKNIRMMEDLLSVLFIFFASLTLFIIVKGITTFTMIDRNRVESNFRFIENMDKQDSKLD
jgi:hypothetical protein